MSDIWIFICDAVATDFSIISEIDLLSIIDERFDMFSYEDKIISCIYNLEKDH